MKRIFLLLTLLAAASPCLGADLRMTLRKNAQPLLAQQRYEEAIQLYVDAAAAQTDDALQAHCLDEAGQIALNQLKDADRALQLAQQVRDPQRQASQALLILTQAKRYQQAIDRAGEADLSQWPVDIRMESQAARGQAYLNLGEHDKAAADLEAASLGTGAGARLTQACFLLGQLYESHYKDQDKAMAAYRRGIEATKASYASRNRCFLRYQELSLDRGQVDEVLAAFAAIDAAKLPSDYWRGEFFLLHARALTLKGQTGQAATLLTAVIRLPEAASAHKAAAQARLAELTAGM